jgi:hypothetical protein
MRDSESMMQDPRMTNLDQLAASAEIDAVERYLPVGWEPLAFYLQGGSMVARRCSWLLAQFLSFLCHSLPAFLSFSTNNMSE